MAQVVNANDYVSNQADSTRCVDERADKSGENLGVQLPGCTEHIMDLMMIALDKSGKSVDEAALLAMVKDVYASDAAYEHKIVMGMHIDDEHGHLDADACKKRVMGCGYDKVRTQVLERMGFNIEYTPGTRIKVARAEGVGIQVLTGDHVANATAAINWKEDSTLKTQSLWEDGRTPSFNHDIWVVKVLLDDMKKVLEDNNFEEAAEILNENALEWSKTMYVETLDILSNGALGEELIEIK